MWYAMQYSGHDLFCFFRFDTNVNTNLIINQMVFHIQSFISSIKQKNIISKGGVTMATKKIYYLKVFGNTEVMIIKGAWSRA